MLKRKMNSLLLCILLAMGLCLLNASAEEPGVSLGVVDKQQGEAILFEERAFPDVSESHWSYESVRKAVELGLTTGRGDGTFGPDADMTRAEFVTMLHRAVGAPEAKVDAAFMDVASGGWYEQAVNWVAESGCVKGISETEFGAEKTITRQEVVTILFRLSGGVSGTEAAFAKVYDEQFADSSAIAPWAKPAMYWSIYEEIISGTAADKLSPEGTATRAQIVTILVRYTEKVLK